MMSVTIKQVAERAGVSRGTVDRVLHDRSGVRPEVAAHVRAVAEEMGFIPNRAGRILAMRKQQLKIGCVYPANFDELEKGMDSAMSEFSDYGVGVERSPISGYDSERFAGAISELAAQGLDALCVAATDSPEVRAAMLAAAEKGMPIITAGLDIEDSGRLCFIGGDYEAEGATAAGMLALRASRDVNLLLVTGPLSLPNHRDRAKAFGRTLVEKGVNSKLVSAFEEHGNYNRTYATTLEALKNRPEINCIYVAGEGISAICRAVADQGRQKDVLVIASDASETTKKLINEGLVGFSVCQDYYEAGSRAIRAVFDYFAKGKTEPPLGFTTCIRILIKENC